MFDNKTDKVYTINIHPYHKLNLFIICCVECREELEKLSENSTRLKTENLELCQDARAAKTYRSSIFLIFLSFSLIGLSFLSSYSYLSICLSYLFIFLSDRVLSAHLSQWSGFICPSFSVIGFYLSIFLNDRVLSDHLF